MPKLSTGESAVRNDGVAAVDRALLIATTLANAGDALTLTEIAQRTGMYKSTQLRLLSSLEKAGLVVHRQDKRYALGPLAFVFGRSFEQTNGLQDAIYPQLAWLVSQGTESPSFHVRHDDENRLCLMRIDSNHSTLDRVRPGDLLPLQRGAAGKVLTAFGEGLSGKNDMLSPAEVLYTSFGERDPLCGAIAAPVFGPSASLVGAMSVSGPLERFSELAVSRMKSLMLKAAQEATQNLGGKWPVHMAESA